MDSFEFENGEMIRDAVVEYMTFGTPKYDENGAIVNAIVYCSGFRRISSGLTRPSFSFAVFSMYPFVWT